MSSDISGNVSEVKNSIECSYKTTIPMTTFALTLSTDIRRPIFLLPFEDSVLFYHGCLDASAIFNFYPQKFSILRSFSMLWEHHR